MPSTDHEEEKAAQHLFRIGNPAHMHCLQPRPYSAGSCTPKSDGMWHLLLGVAPAVVFSSGHGAGQITDVHCHCLSVQIDFRRNMQICMRLNIQDST